jgi:COMPASS component SWD3
MYVKESSFLFLFSWLGSGHGALSPDESSVLLSNLSDGLDLYAVGHNHPVMSFKFSSNGGANLPVQVSFVEHGRGILGGSSEGNVHVWGLASTESRQVLEHDGMLQVLLSRLFLCVNYT